MSDDMIRELVLIQAEITESSDGKPDKEKEMFIVSEETDFTINYLSGFYDGCKLSMQSVQDKIERLKCCGNCGNDCSCNNGEWVCDVWEAKK